jgi:hypothetical protein
MANAREKGKIPRSEWPLILARYTSGASIAQIGREYRCTAPAIRYILKRSGKLAGDTADAASASRRDGSGDAPAVPVPSITRLGGAASPGGKTVWHEVRNRVTGDIAAFLVVLDQLGPGMSAATLADLQDATDRLMRSAARVRLELERDQEVAAPRREEAGLRVPERM